MIRLVVRLDDASMAANVGGGVHTTFRTFDIELPELEGILLASGQKPHEFGYATMVGAEVAPDAARAPPPQPRAKPQPPTDAPAQTAGTGAATQVEGGEC